jgi:VWFA-related protein
VRNSPTPFVVVPAVAALSAGLLAQAQFRTETTIVRVDVVVRDATGQPVEDLDGEAFEVLENGIAQPLVWFEKSIGATVTNRVADDPDAAGPVAWDDAGTVGRPQSVVALVFHQLQPRGRLAATRAANVMVDRLPPGDFAAVYVIDQAMTPLTGFTRERETLRKAIRTVAMTPPADPGPGSSGGVAETGGDMAGGSRSDQLLSAMRGRMAQGETRMFFEVAAGVEGASFSQLIADLDRFPGRRSVILFSEGLTMPLVAPRLESVADKAAPRHVSFYTIDATGFGTGGRRKQSASRIDARELTSISTETGRRPAKVAEMDMSRGLRPLAELTGGLYLADSNDLDAQLARANADRRTFYVLGYRTSAPAAEAGTRPIEVRVSRPDLSVRARTRIGRTESPAGQPPAYDRRTR